MTKLKTLFLLMLVMALGIVTACDDESGETEQEMKNRQLSKTWVVNNVTLAPTTDFSLGSETVTFTFTSSGSYSTSANVEALPNMASPFAPIPTSGSWQFVGNSFNQIRLTSGTTNLLLDITALTDNSLAFTYAGAEPKATDPVTVAVALTPQ